MEAMENADVIKALDIPSTDVVRDRAPRRAADEPHFDQHLAAYYPYPNAIREPNLSAPNELRRVSATDSGGSRQRRNRADDD